MQMPEISLRRISAATALELVEGVAKSDHYEVRVRPLEKRGSPPIYLVQLVPLPRKTSPRQAPAPKKMLQVFSVKQFVVHSGPDSKDPDPRGPNVIRTSS